MEGLDDHDYRARLSKITKRSAILLGILGVSLYLFWPVFSSGVQKGEPNSITIPDPPVEEYRLDVFLLRDASKSPRKYNYGEIEEAVLGHLNTEHGDRITYALFGTDTYPQTIQPPSDNLLSLTALRKNVEQVSFSTTDFAMLFDRVRSAIQNDREHQVKARRPPHADAVIVISDGVPDLTTGSQRCPEPGREFIPREIVEAFNALINGNYATQEPIYVRLVLAGGLDECGPQIEQEWENRLGEVASSGVFQVIPCGEIEQEMESELLTTLRRHPRVLLHLVPPTDQERVDLDNNDIFEVKYSAQSFGGEGTLRVESGSVVDEEERELMALQVLKHPDLLPTKDESHVEIKTPPPAGHSFWGRAIKNSMFFMPVPTKNSMSEFDKYQLRLKIDSGSVVEVNPDYLPIEISRAAADKLEVRERLKSLTWLPVVLGVLFIVGISVWFLTRGASPTGSRWPHMYAERLFVKSGNSWVCAALVLLLPMAAAGIFCAPRPLVLYCAMGVAAVLAGLSFLLDGDSDSDTSVAVHFALHAINIIVLPLIIEGAAARMFREMVRCQVFIVNSRHVLPICRVSPWTRAVEPLMGSRLTKVSCPPSRFTTKKVPPSE